MEPETRRLIPLMIIDDKSRYITHERNKKEWTAAANELGECLKNAMTDCYLNNTLTKEAYISNIQKYFGSAAHRLTFEPNMEVTLVDQYGRPWNELEGNKSMKSPLTGDRTVSDSTLLLNPLGIGNMPLIQNRISIPLSYIVDYWKQKMSGIENPSIDILALGLGPITYEDAKSYIENDPMYRHLSTNGFYPLPISGYNSLQSGDEEEKTSNTTEGKGLSEGQLRDELNRIISNQMSIPKDLSTIFHYSTDEAIDIILKNDSIITNASIKYGVPKAIIQSALLREIRWVDVRDDLADGFVGETKSYYDMLDDYMKMPVWQQLIAGPPTAPLHISNDSSTGLGQIKADTAIIANNWYNEKTGRGHWIDKSDRNQYYNVWDKLRTDDTYNINMSAIVHLYDAYDMEINIDSTSENDIKALLARYNASKKAVLALNNDSDSKVAIHANQVYEYYKVFSNYNK